VRDGGQSLLRFLWITAVPGLEGIVVRLAYRADRVLSVPTLRTRSHALG
jgi:hypothetical protein